MPAVAQTFKDFRVSAARQFAHTMIVIDDEASQTQKPPKIVKLKTPSRLSPARPPTVAANDEPIPGGKHALDAKALIDNAMNLGLVCSVLRPKKGENIRVQMKRVAERADIICLDWEIYKDGGVAATKIIKDIVSDDSKRNGRLRLIAIYTGDVTNNEILKKVIGAFSVSFQNKHDLNREPLYISSNSGLRIVCLFKSHGVQLTEPRSENQVSEQGLPARLLEEFAMLSDGLLSSVALATIAAIRSSTHHVLAKISRNLDGPYFHHRAVLPNVSDAEEYAVDVVLSELKNSVDKQGVAAIYAGPMAIEARIREIAAGAQTLALRWDDKGAKQFDVDVAQVVRLVSEGVAPAHEGVTGQKPKKAIFEKELSTFFSKDRDSAHTEMREFAALTGVRAHPGSSPYNDGNSVPSLGLGAIIQAPDGTYLMCLQASCDSVRLKKKSDFLFIPLTVNEEQPDHVVPVVEKGEVRPLGLSISQRSYASALSISFAPSANTETVVAVRIARRRGIHFASAGGISYRWIASLKQRRALRTAQRLGQDMGRLGFDEFEPFRRKE